jgi:hypothetical protein
MLIRRTRTGIPVIKHKGHEVVAADALALISGANFGSVVKVLAGLHALQAFTGGDLRQLVELSNVPTERVQMDALGDSERRAATRILCEDIAASGRFAYLEDILHLRGRLETAGV